MRCDGGCDASCDWERSGAAAAARRERLDPRSHANATRHAHAQTHTQQRQMTTRGMTTPLPPRRNHPHHSIHFTRARGELAKPLRKKKETNKTVRWLSSSPRSQWSTSVSVQSSHSHKLDTRTLLDSLKRCAGAAVHQCRLATEPSSAGGSGTVTEKAAWALHHSTTQHHRLVWSVAVRG